MKIKVLSILLLLVAAVNVFAGADILKLSARSQNGNVIVFWQSSSESNLKHYIVERKTVNGNFIEVGIVQPRSDRNYEFVDQTAFKGAETLYVYRLKIVDNDGSVSYSWEVAVPHNVSSVKRTWGSIKALFR
ncbi:MAG: hypothetical protein N2321_10700 [Melioribacteraceae bacterium]|nr:hypothetical protein [Melioribacteraceae bacterium]